MISELFPFDRYISQIQEPWSPRARVRKQIGIFLRKELFDLKRVPGPYRDIQVENEIISRFGYCNGDLKKLQLKLDLELER